LFSLQKGSDQLPFEMVDLKQHLTNFSETAAAISQLDLVIGIDSAVIHLTGAIGAPVWVLLPFAPDWRWLLDREDSQWYPTMRLFRQQSAGDWNPVIARVGAALKELAEQKCLKA
jgi:ADP-heptose:LPS heptosyltransferase